MIQNQTPHQPWSRTIAAFLGVLLLIAAALFFVEVQAWGFPDGFISELGRAERILFSAAIFFMLPYAFRYLALVWLAKRKPILRELVFISILAVITLVIFVGIDLYLQQHLVGDGGG